MFKEYTTSKDPPCLKSISVYKTEAKLLSANVWLEFQTRYWHEFPREHY